MNQFAVDVDEGLSSNPKFLSSKYFYNKKGDEIFQKIMELEEYYLTRSEFEILDLAKKSLLEIFARDDEFFQLIEFGAGDGLKTKVLLSHFLRTTTKFKYLPIDISNNALKKLMADLDSTYPTLNGYGICDDYFSALKKLNGYEQKKVVLFLGSNIGNFRPNEALRFLINMKDELNSGDYLLIGIDLKKNPELIRKAYNDSEGITKQFNLNLLERINLELGANFDLNHFDHHPSYDPETGAAESRIISKRDQEVEINSLRKSFSFGKGEKIFTEVSQKYDISQIEEMAENSGFEVINNYFDSNNYFVDTLWRVK